MQTITGYVGTYASSESLGIYRFTMDGATGALSTPELYHHAPDAKYLALSGGLLAAPVQRENKAGILLLDTRVPGALVAERFSEKTTSCYLTMDGDTLCTANFHEGTLRVYKGQGLEPLGTVKIAPKAGCHQVLSHAGRLLVPCMNLDAVRIFHGEPPFAPAGEIAFPKGSGPRHGVFTRDHSRLFVAGQFSHSVFAFRVDEERFLPEGQFPILPGQGGAADETAAIRLSPDERFLYVSTRGADVITVFHVAGTRLELVQQTGSGGKHPRDFVLTVDGRFLLVANRFEGGIISFLRDPDTGRIGEIRGRAALPQVVALVLETAGA